ncbi:PREDICTED: uncharacterized protein LOC102022115 isoform X4 [Chinchilla lanigera]|nr:PREDICTED: uncharacterized protein LOC102022115 isoform X4 [Chinchilla lanigera]
MQGAAGSSAVLPGCGLLGSGAKPTKQSPQKQAPRNPQSALQSGEPARRGAKPEWGPSWGSLQDPRAARPSSAHSWGSGYGRRLLLRPLPPSPASGRCGVPTSAGVRRLPGDPEPARWGGAGSFLLRFTNGGTEARPALHSRDGSGLNLEDPAFRQEPHCFSPLILKAVVAQPPLGSGEWLCPMFVD